MLGTGELLVILCVALILFGGKKLPEFAKNLGIGIREFKKACQGDVEEVSPSSQPHTARKQLTPQAIEVEEIVNSVHTPPQD